MSRQVNRGLAVSDDLLLPVEAVTETFAILGKRGAGKTTAARVLTEELLDAGLPVVVIDPTGVWWGLRSSADGSSAGQQVVIFGGDHADVPLEETAGHVIAEAIIDTRVPAVLDLSHLSKSAGRRLVTDFLERLYHRNREPMHVVIDEADLFAPQRTVQGGERCLGAMNDLARRGRVRGLGVTLISQRPAVLNKDVLTQAEVLIALRLIGARDRAAIDEWIEAQADQTDVREVISSLPSLPVGTAWVWSPGWLETLAKVQIRRPRTFDSSATPKAGQVVRTPKQMAQVDLDTLREHIAATVEKAKADNPAELRRRLAVLQAELDAARRTAATPVPAPPPQVVEVPVLSDAALAELTGLSEQAAAWANKAIEATQTLTERVREATLAARRAPVAPAPGPSAPAPPRRTARPSPAAPVTPAGSGGLAKAERAILSVLAQHGTRSTVQVALLTAYSHKSGGYRNALSKLRTAGYIDGRGEITATPEGIEALGGFDPLPTGVELRRWWGDKHLGKAERAILDVLADAYPHPVPTPQIAEETGYSATSGGFRNAMSRLRTLEIASGHGELVMSDALAETPGVHA